MTLQSRPETTPDRASIFVVDDEPPVTRILRSMLEVGGYAVEEVNDPSGLVDRVVESQPELVFLDLNLPQANGFDLFAEIQARTGDRIGVVLLTGESDSAVAERALASGMLEHLVKPVSLERLLATARIGIRLQRAIRSAGPPSHGFESPQLLVLESLVEEGVAHIEASGEIRRLDATASNLLGVTATEAPGRPLSDLCDAAVSELLELGAPGSPGVRVLRTTARASGRRLEVRGAGWQVDGGAGGVVLVMRPA